MRRGPLVVSHCTSTGAAVTVSMPASMASTASAPDPRRIKGKGKSSLSAARLHVWAEIRWQDWRRGGLDTPCAYPHTPVTAEALRPGAQSKTVHLPMRPPCRAAQHQHQHQYDAMLTSEARLCACRCRLSVSWSATHRNSMCRTARQPGSSGHARSSLHAHRAQLTQANASV